MMDIVSWKLLVRICRNDTLLPRAGMAGAARQGGFTILELLLSMTLTALIMAPLASIMWQITVAPVETSGSVTVEVQARNVGIAIPDDTRTSQRVTSGDDPVFANFEWVDFTGTSAEYHTVRYSRSTGDQAMVRITTVDGVTEEVVIISRFLDLYTDASIGFRDDLAPFLLETSVSPELDTPLGTQKSTFSTLSFLRAPAGLTDTGEGSHYSAPKT